MTPTPLFSIITVCYNAAETLGCTLGSVDGQSFDDYEHLIVDGASRDASLEIARSMPNDRRRIISEPDKGIYDAMNKGISASTGTYLIFLNAGDKFHATDSLEKIAKAIHANQMPGIIYGQTNIVDNEGQFLAPRHLTAPHELTLKSFATGMVVCHQAFVALRRIAGFYNLKYRYSADYEWCIRCLQHSRKNIGLADTVLIDYLNEGVTTRNRIPSLRERFKIMVYYYGFFPTVWRRIGFIGRWWNRRKQEQQ